MTKLNIVCADQAFAGSIVKSFPEDYVTVWNRMKQPCDLLVLTGGVDIGTTLYGERNFYADYADSRRDQKEMAAWDSAYKNDIPILGICRGFQLGCVLLGGSLLQDLYAEAGIFHSGEHDLSFERFSNIGIFTSFPTVNSMHHQGFAPEKKETNIDILAHHKGVAEIVEFKDKFFGVQFHPEFMDRNKETVEFFESVRNWATNKKHDAFLLPENECYRYQNYEFPYVYGGMTKKSVNERLTTSEQLRSDMTLNLRDWAVVFNRTTTNQVPTTGTWNVGTWTTSDETNDNENIFDNEIDDEMDDEDE